MWSGANDLFLALETSSNPLGDIVTAATCQVAAVGTPKAAGARYILVSTLPDVGATPVGASLGPANAAAVTALSSAYNQVLYGGLAAARIQVIPLDPFSLLREIGADPAPYGFAMPAFAPERTWGTAVVGVGAKFSPTLSGNLALSTRIAQDDVRAYAMQVGLSLGF